MRRAAALCAEGPRRGRRLDGRDGRGGAAQPAPRCCGSRSNGGKGTAIRAGLERLLASDATHVALVDGDGQHDPDDLPALLAAARAGEDFVIGSRVEDPEATPAYRYRTNEIGSKILSRMTGLEIEDGQSGYRVLAASLLRRLDLNARGYIIETEILLKAAHHVRKLRHVPVRVDLRRPLALPAVPRHVGDLVGGGVLQSLRDD